VSLLRVTTPGREPWELELEGDEFVVGRAPECEIQIDEDGISRRHAVLRRTSSGDFILEDLGSRNGTFVNGERVDRAPIRPGDRMRLGQGVELSFDPEEGGTGPRGDAGSAVERRGGGPFAWFREVEYGLRPAGARPGAPMHALRSRVTTVGREASAGLAIDDESVSRVHAKLARDGDELVVTDLKSRNGTEVNGEPVLQAVLDHGDELRFGDVAFTVVRREGTSWRRMGMAAGSLAGLVVLVFGAMKVSENLAERGAVAETRRRIERQAVQSVSKGIAAWRRGEADFSRSYLLYAADVLQLSGLAPPGASLDRPRELFRNVARELPPGDRDFDFGLALDPGAAAAARARLEDLTPREMVERETRRIAVELGQDEGVPVGFVDEVWSFVDGYMRHPGTFQGYLNRSPRLHPMIVRKLKEAHLPEVFAYVSWIESGLDPQATSPVGARGLWQFMPATGQGYGLRVDPASGVDERTDPIRSTEAATRYIGNLIRKFGREQFMCALASYNRGEGAVWRAMEKIPDPMMESSRKYWYMVENRMLPQETSQYVPKIVAAAILGQNPERFGFRRPG
jgi:pSer/pThr/pTyr-binding forkhead associated (FHA) protein